VLKINNAKISSFPNAIKSIQNDLISRMMFRKQRMFKSQEKQKLSKVQILVIVAFIQTRNSKNNVNLIEFI